MDGDRERARRRRERTRAQQLSGGAGRLGRPAAGTGRVHHLGGPPELMPVWGPDGEVRMTRTSAAQLAERTLTQLRRLEATIAEEMAEAAAAAKFEQAAWLRDELQAVRAELTRRG